jgi:hypothetical protein
MAGFMRDGSNYGKSEETCCQQGKQTGIEGKREEIFEHLI